MKRLTKFEFNPEGKWAVLSGVLMGIAFFAGALDHLGLRSPGSVGFFRLLVALILPLAVEAAWCLCLRVIRLTRAEVYGVFGGICCLLMLLQSFYYGNVLLTLLFIFLLLVAGAAMVLVSFGYLTHRALGFLVLLLVALLRGLVMAISRFGGERDWMGFLQDLPQVCRLLALAAFFGNLKKAEITE